MAQAGLTAWLKTSGGPVGALGGALEPQCPTTWVDAKAFGERLCRDMAAYSAKKSTVALTKAQRSERIFLDDLPNDPGHAVSLLSAPSPSRRPGLHARELEGSAKLDAKAFTIWNAVERLGRKDPWQGI